MNSRINNILKFFYFLFQNILKITLIYPRLQEWVAWDSNPEQIG